MITPCYSHAFQLEHLLTLMARMPEGAISDKLQQAVISLRQSFYPNSKSLFRSQVFIVYHDLPHPPTSYLGQRFAWRSADGSGNNLNLPDLGRANTPYSRSVQQQHPMPRDQLPDASLIFDTLLKRDNVSV